MKCANCYNAVAEMLAPKEETIRTQQAEIDRLTGQLAEVEAIKALQAEQESQLQKMKELFLAVTGQRDAAVKAVRDIIERDNFKAGYALIAEIEAENVPHQRRS